MKKIFPYICLLMLVVPVLPVLAVEMTTVEQTEQYFIVEFSGWNLRTQIIDMDGVPARRYFIPEGAPVAKAGAPDVPHYVKSFLLPPGKSAKLTVLSDDYTSVPESRIALFPQMEMSVTEDGQVQYTRTYIPDPVLTQRLFPERIAELGRLAVFRKQPYQNIVIYPLQYNKIEGMVRVHQRLRIRIDFADESAVNKQAGRGNVRSAYTDAYFKNAINGRSRAAYHGGLPRMARPVQTDVNLLTYQMKLSVSRDGMYKITGAMLRQAGAVPEDINPELIQVFEQETEIPLVMVADGTTFTDDSYFVFYGQRYRSGDSYYNLYTDRNVYWLRWNTETGLRYTPVDGNIRGTTFGDYFQTTVHIENDEFYHDGNTDVLDRMTDYVPYEDWYWQSYYSDYRMFQYPLLPGVAALDDSASIRIRLLGVTNPSITYSGQHQFMVYLNQLSPMGPYAFSGAVDYIQELSIPQGTGLTAGLQTMSIQNTIPAGEKDLFYLDWIEFDYWRKYLAVSDYLEFAPARNGLHHYTISGLTDTGAVLLDLEHQTLYENVSYEASSGTYTAVFSDTVSGTDKRFVIAAATGFSAPDSLATFQYTNLRNPSNEADYLIVSHRNFLSEADRLAQYREQSQNGLLKTMVVNVQQVYDEFNDGIFSPEAVKEFLLYAYQHWARFPSYLLLFGDASIDTKSRSGSTNRDFVPSYGVPSSDNWYTMLDGEDDYVGDLAAGRIPCTTREEASDYIDKVMEYEAQSPGAWVKKVVMISGGINANEQDILQTQNEWLIASYLKAPPSCLHAYPIQKTSTQFIDYSFRAEIIDYIDDGVLWINNMGHAAVSQYDVDFGRPDDWSNYGLYPFTISFSCNTGRFSTRTGRSLGEEFILATGKGSIASFGTTGWGVIDLDNRLSDGLFHSVFQDTVHALGMATLFARNALANWQFFDYDQEAKNIVMQYSYLGDPAVNLALPELPEYSVSEEDIRVSPAYPAESDTGVTIWWQVNNFGLCSGESLAVSLTDRYQDSSPTPVLPVSRIPAIAFQDTLLLQWDISNQAGSHNLTATIDPNDAVREVSEFNNEIQKDVEVSSGSLTLIYPLPYSQVRSEEVSLTVLAPVSQTVPQRDYYFEVDTSAAFENPFSVSEAILSNDLLVTHAVTLPRDQQWYCWRVRVNDDETFSPWTTGYFYADRQAADTTVWKQTSTGWNGANLQQTDVHDAVTLQSRYIRFRAESAGQFDGGAASVFVDEQPVIPSHYDSSTVDDLYSLGFYFVTVEPTSGDVLDAVYYNTNQNAAHAAAMQQHIERLPEGTIAIGAVINEAAGSITSGLRNALSLLGCRYADDLGAFDSYAFIGRKGAAIGTIPEQLSKRNQGRVIKQDSLQAFYKYGTVVSPVIQGAYSWQSVQWSADEPDGASSTLSLFGFNSAVSDWDTLLQEISDRSIDLTAFSVEDYPRLQLSAELHSEDGAVVPSIHFWQVSYIPAGNMSIGFRDIHLDPDSIYAGEKLGITFYARNTGFRQYEDVEYNVRITNSSSETIYTSDMKHLGVVMPGDSAAGILEIPVTGEPGEYQASVSLDPMRTLIEGYTTDNTAARQFQVTADTLLPDISVLVDGLRIRDGDYVTSTPEIHIQLLDNSPVGISDTSQAHVYLDNQLQSYHNNPNLVFNAEPVQSDLVAEIVFTPQLESGDHILRVEVHDRGDNSTSLELHLQVHAELLFEDVFNFPNPFSTTTSFSYILTQPADEVTLRIFTVAGRLIWEHHNLPHAVGMNMIRWDGLDADGDNIANGTYLYRFIGRSGDKVATHTGNIIQ